MEMLQDAQTENNSIVSRLKRSLCIIKNEELWFWVWAFWPLIEKGLV